jgi:muramoyltetrapeptide carboxypeptidase
LKKGKIFPRKLQAGDTIGIVAPSFFIEKREDAQRGFETIEQLGFKIKYGRNVFNRFENTTASAQQRADEINEMFCDKTVGGIICTDGGCRAIELVKMLDYEAIRNNPKLFIGSSDITHLQMAIYAKANVPSVYGLDIVNGFGQSENARKQCIINFFLALVKHDCKHLELPEFSPWRVLRKGKCRGTLVGGWLDAINNLSGSEYFPEDEKIILFWEAVSLEQNKIMMILNSLQLSNWFDKVKGMIIGKLTDCEEIEYHDCIPNFYEFIIRIAEKFNFPVITNVDFGHVQTNLSLPIGLEVEINTEKKIIRFIESYSKNSYDASIS